MVESDIGGVIEASDVGMVAQDGSPSSARGGADVGCHVDSSAMRRGTRDRKRSRAYDTDSYVTGHGVKRSKGQAPPGSALVAGSIVEVQEGLISKRGVVVQSDGVHAKQARNFRASRGMDSPVLVLHHEVERDFVHWVSAAACKVID